MVCGRPHVGRFLEALWVYSEYTVMYCSKCIVVSVLGAIEEEAKEDCDESGISDNDEYPYCPSTALYCGSCSSPLVLAS